MTTFQIGQTIFKSALNNLEFSQDKRQGFFPLLQKFIAFPEKNYNLI